MTVLQRWKQTALHNKLIVILMVIGTIIAAWQLLSHAPPPITQHSEGHLSPNIIENKGNITIQGDLGQKQHQNLIDTQCVSKMLTTTPLAPGETLKVLQLWPTHIANGGGGIGEMFVSKGSDFTWPKPPEGSFPILEGYQCKITNYMADPIFNVQIELQEDFRECIRDPKQPAQMHEGKPTLTRGWPINIPKIDAGIGNAFVFYIFNVSDKVVIVSIPDAVTLTMADNTLQTLRLVHSGPMMFWPQLNLPALPKP